MAGWPSRCHQCLIWVIAVIESRFRPLSSCSFQPRLILGSTITVSQVSGAIVLNSWGPACSASEVLTVWRYRNSIINIIIIMATRFDREQRILRSDQGRRASVVISRFECTRVHFVQVSVSVSRPDGQGLGLET